MMPRLMMSGRESWQPGVSPWTRILPHFLRATRTPLGEVHFGGIRDFVAEASSCSALDDRFVFPSKINMSIFRGPEPVAHDQKPMPARFIVSCRNAGEVQLRFDPEEASKPTLIRDMNPADAIRAIADCYRQGAGWTRD